MSDEDKTKEDILSKVRRNPWILSSIILGILFLGSLFLGIGLDRGASVESESVVGEKVLNFLNSRVTGEVVLSSIELKDNYYEIFVSFEGDTIPIYSDLNGNYIFSDIVPTENGIAGGSAEINDGEELENTKKISNLKIGNSPVLGDINAEVTIVEFSDYQCPFCARFYSETLGLIKVNYIDTGKVKLVFKDFPLSFHPQAQNAAEAARCFADQGDYYLFHDKLFENQNLLADEIYLKWATELGADSVEFSECMKTGKYTESVTLDFDYGSSLGISGTPGFFINGKTVSGAQPYSVFKQLIDAELAEN